VLRLVEGDGATGAALVEHSDFIAFTGSVATGRRVGEAAARAFIPPAWNWAARTRWWCSPPPIRRARPPSPCRRRAGPQASMPVHRARLCRAPLLPAFLDALVPMAAAVPLNTASAGAPGLGPFISAAQADIVQAPYRRRRVARRARARRRPDRGPRRPLLRPTILVTCLRMRA
jgi:acyl-CoA reductase-like NAD-dependent aldehyde dehydrogenase